MPYNGNPTSDTHATAIKTEPNNNKMARTNREKLRKIKVVQKKRTEQQTTKRKNILYNKI